MSFTTISFIVFFSIVLLVFYTVPRKYQRFVLLIASYIFYSYTSFWALVMMVAITAITYFGARQISIINNNEKCYIKNNELDKAEKKLYKPLQ